MFPLADKDFKCQENVYNDIFKHYAIVFSFINNNYEWIYELFLVVIILSNNAVWNIHVFSTLNTYILNFKTGSMEKKT